MNEVEIYKKKGILFSAIFIIIGLVAAVAGEIFSYQKDMMFGIMIGFLPTGVGTFILCKLIKNTPDTVRKIEIENEERNVFIRAKAGQIAFWITYIFIFVTLVFQYSIKISLNQFLVVALVFMPVVYFLCVFIYQKKY